MIREGNLTLWQERFRVASIADFLVMKSYALAKRDKPKDAYDICYCIYHHPKGMKQLASTWKKRLKSNLIQDALSILRDKFSAVDQCGPNQVMEFYNSSNREERKMRARRAFELAQAFLTHISQIKMDVEKRIYIIENVILRGEYSK